MKIVKRYVSGINTAGYVVENNGEKLLSYEDIIKLCKENKIDNAKIVINKDSYEILIKDNIATIYRREDREKFVLTLREINSSTNEVIGYILKSSVKRLKLQFNDLWKFAKDNNVTNVKAILVNGNKAIAIENIENIECLKR